MCGRDPVAHAVHGPEPTVRASGSAAHGTGMSPPAAHLPTGSPNGTGGQFARTARTESHVTLDPPDDRCTVTCVRNGEHVYAQVLIDLNWHRTLTLSIEPQPMSRRAAERVARRCETDPTLTNVAITAF